MKVPGSTLVQEEDDRDSLIVALDFGTTFSGIAYSFSTDPEKIYTITEWPGGEDRIVPKTPTTIWYEPHRKDSFDWGYAVDMSTGDKITALKLLFDPDQKRPYPIPDNFAEMEIAKLPKPVVEVAADYMKAIFNHAMEEIEADSVDPTFVECFQKKFVLTVPAVWSDKAKSMTLAAARKAGISPVEMITEPEAAALYTLHSMKSKGLQPGDAVVICDAGGGTVDLVSYEILSLDPFKLRALTAPSGGVCGSLMVNELFEEEVRMTVGETAFSELRRKNAYWSGLTDFDIAIKPAFRGWGDRDKYVSFPMAGLRDNAALGLVSNTMTLSSETMVRIFDPIVKEIESLVAEQVAALRLERLEMDEKPEKGVAAIFLVGGFGSSVYLKSIIEQSNSGVRVIQPREAWSAIVKGAVMSRLGIAPIVTTSKAAKHYGVSCLSLWDEFQDHGHRKVIDEWDELPKCKTMQWYIYKNDNLTRDEKTRFPFYSSLGDRRLGERKLTLEYSLYECSSLLAPTHPVGVQMNCTLKLDLSRVPEKHFVRKTRPSDGVAYEEIHYFLVIENNQSGLMKFSVEVDGKEYSAVDAMY